MAKIPNNIQSTSTLTELTNFKEAIGLLTSFITKRMYEENM